MIQTGVLLHCSLTRYELSHPFVSLVKQVATTTSKSDLVQDVTEVVQFGQLDQIEPGRVCNPLGRLCWNRVQIQRRATYTRTSTDNSSAQFDKKYQREPSKKLNNTTWHNLCFGSLAFRISAPHIWNSLPTNIREAQSLLTFRRHLKTHYFQSAFSIPLRPARQRALILFKISALYKSFTNLLTYLLTYNVLRGHYHEPTSYNRETQ